MRRGLEVSIALPVFVVIAAATVFAQTASDPLIPYQGQLADQSGAPVSPEEPITIVFRTYTQPFGGTATWEEPHENVHVVAGRFSVLLGARQPFPADVIDDFNRTVYLGLTVDDGNRETADVEMRPRQAIVPVILARRALHAEHADRAAVAEELDEESAVARELASLRSYVGDLRQRIRNLQEALAAR